AAGIQGGELLANGTPAEIKRSDKSLTGLFLKSGITHPTRGAYRSVEPRLSPSRLLKRLKRAKVPGETDRPGGWLELRGAALRNLKNFDLRLPLGRLIMVAGPSGAGKSTLFRDLLDP